MAEKTVPAMKEEKNVVKREVTRHPEYFVTPLVDIYETDEGLTLLADLPGVEKDGLKVSVEEGILTLEGKVAERNRQGLLIQEFEPVNYFRQFELSEAVDQNRISAELKHGVLTLHLPKAEKAKPRQIEVRVS
ncbi:MAG: heat shock protein, Hsp20 family [Candidatus Ozemobacter sibiricus]|jgi:HSP20 family molecular chaperone IbpA|uniref:Heat shock protein, Hsp20 family n=1 Tax=Candidatus Ozemobacter sibiricus TaxID=2268124 RepID=A0A367ZMW7_9BACT|nr:MAG: heat shock protein, Hsp20 family [Candidatus Ozemobacter sibiricus]